MAFRRKIGAIERITHFQSQCVACAEPARLDSKFLSLLEDGVPKLHRVARAKENFYAVFAGVAGARHRYRHSLHLNIDNVVSRRKIHEKFGDARTLNGDASKMLAAIC